MGLSRRAMLALAGGVAAQPVFGQGGGDLPLWAAARRNGILFGASAAWEILRDNDYASLHRKHSRLLVTDLAMKFDYIRPREDVFSFEQADALLAFARENGMPFRAHTLFWNDYPPPWLKGKNAREIERIFELHLEIVATRYAGAVQSWDVVNEPLWPDSGMPGGFRRGPWYDAMGENYIFRAFERLAKIDTTAKLVLNEAFTEQDDRLGRNVRQHFLPLVDRMLDRGLKLDAIGLQAHLKPGLAFDIDAFLRFIEEIARRRLEIYLTEFDVDDQHYAHEIAIRDADVARFGENFLTPVLKNKAVKALITWHLSDRYTWYREPGVAAHRVRNFPARPLPFDEDMREKPLAAAIRRALLAAGPR
ncbi:MAG: endo-1,4-beta-xylanase [Methylobacterium sp.]|nr:endo-1,4-beta-xylanase [Methylobacterium sp.]MCA3605126.1 endo-1,4-beta-xylanase [Methylobacterium sp.]MCA3608855.1 endo-1,4-beta-xylanase [Methylobacterium sp.]MCA3619346.1 endo-1,4-beta-xylanase [Methylobacterium sp.]MCA3622349.1 endo-1,4-beta-xylanase [Methylobacterium sp.]